MSDGRRPRILVVIGHLDVGGAEMDIIRNLPAIERNRFELMVYAFERAGALAPLLVDAGIPVHVPPEKPKWTSSPQLQELKGKHRDGAEALPRVLRKLRLRTRVVLRPVVLELRRDWRTMRMPAALVLAPVRLVRLGFRCVRVLFLLPPVKLVGRQSRLANYGRVILPLRRFIIENDIDAVHCFLPNAYFYGALAATLAGRRNIIMSRLSLNHYHQTQPFYASVEPRLLHKLVRIAVGNATAVLDDLSNEGIPRRKLFLLYNGIETEKFAPSAERRARSRQRLGIEQDAFLITAVGNLHPYKGHEDLIKALASVSAELPQPWKLLIAGSDRAGHGRHLEKMISELGLSDRITLLGHRDDVAELLAASDLHAMPSHEEGLPNSIIEAMASGLPIVATRVGGIPELVLDGENGLLTPPHDSEKLAAAILQVARDDDARHEIARRNVERATANFSLEHSVARYEELYSLLETPSRYKLGSAAS